MSMRPLLVASRDDVCAMNMASYLIDQCSMEEVYADGMGKKRSLYSCPYFMLMLMDGSALEAEWIDSWIREHDASKDGASAVSTLATAECYIFLSRHRSESGRPTLTSHSTGNFSNATMGGNAGELAYTYPNLQKGYMLNLYSNRGRVPDYDIVIEATHHGPTSLARPVLFIEIGSSEREWNDTNAVSVVCESLIATLMDFKQHSSKVCIALGGTHYPDKFTRLLIDSDIALASVASKHNLRYVDEHMMRQMVEKSVEPVRYILLDWKGLGGEKDRIVELANSMDGMEVIRV
ncbi:MAG: D-aminoacyl-tRNA deacylase [Candidatus Nitrosocaldus sp.]|nr:D-aminoacyl-tRNA deacylase [Candidatus Nitrosocaldus sp.]